MSKLNFYNYKLKLIILTLVCLLFVKIFSTSNVSLIISSYVFDVLVYAFIFFLFLFASLKISRKLTSPIFYILYFYNTLQCFMYAYFANDLSNKAYSFFSVKLDTAIFVAKQIINYKLILLCLLIFVAIFVVAYLIKLDKLIISRKAIKICFFVVLGLVIVYPVIFGNYFANPYVDTIRYLFEDRKELVDLNIDINYDFNLFDKSFSQDLNFNFDPQMKYKKIFVFVMEEIPNYMFYKDIKKVPVEKNFFEKNKENSIVYKNYYTNNQDSRTAMLTMLSSTLIPYESYSYSDWYSLYAEKVIKKQNLVDYFNDNNYNTTFLISDVGAPFEITKYNFKNIITLKEEDYGADEDLICMHLIEFEKACEDRAVFGQLKELANNNEKQFVYQELIYGHTLKYIALKDQSRTEYYNYYFDDFYNYLKEIGKSDETLIVIVSDHGEKGYFNEKNHSSYNVPLIFVASDLEQEENYDLLSHLNFKDLLLSYVAQGYNFEKNNDIIFSIGSTSTGLVSYIDKNNNFAVVSSISSPYVVFDNGADVNYSSEKYLLFNKYLDYFNSHK
ncbi:MAG: sulfatase-like hydrolase/transferase [Candidatus ainarchaeum sp.]|nr:sulfatase-like hydrolase/transferase [Candidatus ainarchaeum sp.]